MVTFMNYYGVEYGQSNTTRLRKATSLSPQGYCRAAKVQASITSIWKRLRRDTSWASPDLRTD